MSEQPVLSLAFGSASSWTASCSDLPRGDRAATIPESKQAMEKRQLIISIREMNPTATEAFLRQFAEADLDKYLCRLKDAAARSIRIIGWAARPQGLRKVS